MQRRLTELERVINQTLECFDAIEEKRVELRRKRDWDEVFSELTLLTNKRASS